MADRFDIIIVGTGFASSFFLDTYLKKNNAGVKVLLLERGRKDPHAWQLRHRRPSSMDMGTTFVNKNGRKPWFYTPGLGGGSNCWWAVTPRMLPSDFRLQSTYGVGVDWPLTYDELEEFYCHAEEIMAVSGPDDGAPSPRSRPYPQPPHRFSDPDKLLKAAYPQLYFQQPTARARRPTANRSACCASGVCHLCPMDAKFTIHNEMAHLYQDPRVTLRLEATALQVDTRGGQASGVTFEHQGKTETALGDLVVLGANALFNPHLLMQSNLLHPLLGRNLHEQVSITADIDLDGVNNFQGSTSITGHGYMLYDGAHRSNHAGCLIESWNLPALRLESGKWRQRLQLKFLFEDLPTRHNYVRPSLDNPDLPETVYLNHSDYAQRGIDKLPEKLPEILRPLPVEKITLSPKLTPTENHILGTTVMGNDPANSIVDRHLIHHQIRNLIVLGSGVFPTSSPANPTLTLSALSLWSAHHLLR
jgi:choline dehydrogenase-like flavoprotein